MNYIEKVLFDKTADFQEGQIYSDQWKFVKSYLPSVLDTISQIFPHYSLHNATHSEAIINNIVRILGTPSIERLSVVDLWLLLAAAYYHDCGMVVTGEDKKALFEDGSEFIHFIEEQQNDLLSPLNRYAILFEIKEQKAFFKVEQLTKDSYEAARFLIAGFIRGRHAVRSGKRIESESSLHLPGNPIPERIIRILKAICDCHTKDVNEVMALQSVESSGCGIEDCHPRFVAAMLRLGDLLDIDSNRVSEVLLSTLGSIPSDSKFFNKTNKSITHIRIDQSIIEITAECNDYQVADLVNRWLQWLNDELVFYMKRWHKIIPFEEFGYLPTVGDLKVNLSNYDTFDGKKRPSFEIDSSKAIELLQGAGLYTDSCECIRELLQNAVDATYLRVYKENPGIKDLNKFKKECEKFPITVKLDRIPEDDTKKEKSKWKIEITDRGIGMTKEDLQYLSKTGSSGRNKEKQQLIQSVPEFLWPSGSFGIGFQSVFLITDKVFIISRKLNKDHYVKAEMHNPSGKEKGAILIQTIDKEDVHYGTTLSFVFEDFSDRQQLINSEDRYSVAELFSFDFAKNKDANFLGVKIMDEIVRFANSTFIHVDFVLDGENKQYVSKKSKVDFGPLDKETGIQVYVEKKKPISDGYFESKVYFRNQWIRDYYPDLPFLSFHVNILKGNAKDVLTLNRNRVRREYEPILADNIKKTVIRHLNDKIESFDATSKQLASMFLELYSDYISEKGIKDIKMRDYWKKLELTLRKANVGEKEIIILDRLLNADSIERVYNDDGPDRIDFVFGEISYSIDCDYIRLYWIYDFIAKIAKKKGYSPCFKEGRYALCKNKCSLIDESEGAKLDVLFRYLRNGGRARGMIPCSEKYLVLQVDKDAFPKRVWSMFISDYPIMICPYVRRYDIEKSDEALCLERDIDSKVINTVFENRKDKSVTKDQIKKAYEEFVKEWDPIVDKVNTRAKKEQHRPYMAHRYSIML